MDILHSVTLTVHILVGLSVIGLVLLQHGKGADMGAAFGSGFRKPVRRNRLGQLSVAHDGGIGHRIFHHQSGFGLHGKQPASDYRRQRHGCGEDGSRRASSACAGHAGRFEGQEHTEIMNIIFVLQRN